MAKSYNSMICTECGCADFRFDKNMGKYCNNCGAFNPYYYDKYENNVTVDSLKKEYRENLKVSIDEQ